MDWLRLAGLVVLGWGAGALVNYLGDVLPITRRFTSPVCSQCGRPFLALDFLLLRPCRQCGAQRKRRAWIVQVLAVLAVAGLGFNADGPLGFWPGLAVLLYFGVVAVIDLEHRLILHPVSLAGAALGGGIGLWLHGWLPTLLGGLAGFGIMLGLYYLGALFAKWLARARKKETDEDALGFGDVALSGVLGLLLGWPGIAAGLVLAILLGGAGSLAVLVYSLVARRYHDFMAIPYGPFLIVAAVMLLFRAR
jgi:leader peptidase (prepilin peptidase)/N-methyltransferase